MFYLRQYVTSKISTLTKLRGSILQNLPINPAQLREQHQQQQRQRSNIKKTKDSSKVQPMTFNTPHPPKDPPENYNPTAFTHVAFDAPDYLPFSIWRPFKKNDEQLGPKAAKSAEYKNPEYYSYHRYSFVEIQRNVLKLRKKRAESGGADEIVTVYDCEEESAIDFDVTGKLSENKSSDDDPRECAHDTTKNLKPDAPKEN